MEPSEDITIEVLVAAPSSLIRSLLQSAIIPRRHLESRPGELSANGDPSVKLQIVAKTLSSDGSEEVSLLMDRFPNTPILVLSKADTRQITAAVKAPDVKESLGLQGGREEPLTAASMGGTGENSSQVPGTDGDLPGPPMEEPPLSGRELDVLEVLAQGATNQQISATLCISRNTVKTHVRHIIGKLNIANRTQAALLGRNISQWRLARTPPKVASEKVA